jgi:hypothetical protein
MTFWRSSAGKVLISWIKISTFDIIVFDKEDFTTTNYGFSFKLLIFIVFPHYFNSFLFLSDNFRQTLGQIYRFVYIINN